MPKMSPKRISRLDSDKPEISALGARKSVNRSPPCALSKIARDSGLQLVLRV